MGKQGRFGDSPEFNKAVNLALRNLTLNIMRGLFACFTISGARRA